jgi:hypothetical protein
MIETMPEKLALVAAITLLINIPFGYWREGLRKFSLKWMIAVHAAVPFVIAARMLAGIHWRILPIAFLVFCYFLGQFSGARLRRCLRPPEVIP